jgi:hypothetical protein
MLTWEREDGRGPWVCDDGGGTGSSQRQLAMAMPVTLSPQNLPRNINLLHSSSQNGTSWETNNQRTQGDEARVFPLLPRCIY